MIERNPYVKVIMHAGELLRSQPSIGLNIVIKDNHTKDKTLNKPTSDEIAVLLLQKELLMESFHNQYT